MENRIITAIGKHIIAQQALAGGGEGIGIDESAEAGDVVAGLEVVQAGFNVLGLATMSNYTIDTDTKPQRFRVGIFKNVRYSRSSHIMGQ